MIAAAAPLDAIGRDGTLLLRGCYFAELRRTPALKPRLARLTAAAALGLPVARGAGRPQRLGPDRERRGPRSSSSSSWTRISSTTFLSRIRMQ